MKFNKALFIGFNGNEFSQEEWQQVDNSVETRVLIADMQSITADEADADAILVRLGAKVDKGIIDSLPKLKYIGMLGTGFAGIDGTYAAGKNITVTNIADYATQAVTEFTFGVILEHLREVSKARVAAAAGDYSDANYSGSEIKGKSFGVIGLRNIGMRTAELAKAFGANVSYWSRNRKSETENVGINFIEADMLIAQSDIITLNLSLNKDTEGFLTKQRIDSLKPGCIVVNVSPMELLDFQALTNRLAIGDITFVLDHSDEMKAEQLETLRKFSNCIIYPAIGYLTAEAGNLKRKIYIDNLKNFLDGKPTNKVN